MEALRFATEVADGLEHAHRRGVVHRDVKPANIFLQGGRALLADFGIARFLDTAAAGRLTDTGVPLIPAFYMSPEQFMGTDDIDHRTDVYSLACVLYETLAGRPPFEGPGAVAVATRALREDPPPLTRYRSRAGAVEPVLARALQRLPADRFATAEELGRALRSVSP